MRRPLGLAALLSALGCASLATDERAAPADVPRPADVPAVVTQVSAGGGHACARLSDGTVRCWGAAARGQAGSPGAPCRAGSCVATPTAVAGLAGVTQVAAGGAHACALRDGRVWCWGANAHGELGVVTAGRCGAASEPCALAPAPIADLVDAVQVAAGGAQTCVLRAGGAVRCWGAFPLAEGDLVGAAEVSVGLDHACARMIDGTVRCWGGDTLGQLGAVATEWCDVDGVRVPCARRPQALVRLDGVAQVAAGAQVTCARMTDATVRCWGSNVGREIGVALPYCAITGSLVSCTYFPHTVPGATGARSIAAGSDDVCMTRASGELLCWGSNQSAQLGVALDGGCPGASAPCAMAPVAVPGLAGVVGVSTGARFTCAWRGDGATWCWGEGSTGAIGDGGQADRATPTRARL